eukprot:GCRY01002630.1.p1 GENE.GCRY01002630.1~~GCRY01002630.1.p1  ORF type:complete len:858 (-),score=233.66 GCRY01002630.1:127-2700(-)
MPRFRSLLKVRCRELAKCAPLAQTVLDYDIHSYSSYSANYLPENIKTNKPRDQGNRWSSGSSGNNQFLMLKLKQVSLLKAVVFGKYNQNHVCNIKEFKVYVGYTVDNLVEVLHSGLKNDSHPETFYIPRVLMDPNSGEVYELPVRYVKIVPLAAFGEKFNFSIWFLQLLGLVAPDVIDYETKRFSQLANTQAARVCLKFFRHHNHLDLFDSLQARLAVNYEGTKVTDFFNFLVKEGDFVQAEQILITLAHKGAFDEYLSTFAYRVAWSKLTSPQLQSNAGVFPQPRGGHQVVVHSETNKAYMFGGWNGQNDLGDFWSLDLNTLTWDLIHGDTGLVGGPEKRSCHKMCIDSFRGHIYVFGRFVNVENSSSNRPVTADFYRYDIQSNTWTLLSPDTEMEGGPPPVFDHQLALDVHSRMLYVVGGRVMNDSPNVVATEAGTEHLGIWRYDISAAIWTCLREDHPHLNNDKYIVGRLGHSLVFDRRTHQLLIFAGQRLKDYLADLLVYDIETDTLTCVSKDMAFEGGPEAGFTQRASYNEGWGEMFVMSGMSRDKIDPTRSCTTNTIWMYSMRFNRWTKLYSNDNTDESYWNLMSNTEPCPRFAHQFFLSPRSTDCNVRCFLYGGNPGEHDRDTAFRLSDLWELNLARLSQTDLLNHCQYLLRKQQFLELCEAGRSHDALMFLQRKISPIVNNSDSQQVDEFKKLSTVLFKKSGESACHTEMDMSDDSVEGGREKEEEEGDENGDSGALGRKENPHPPHPLLDGESLFFESSDNDEPSPLEPLPFAQQRYQSRTEVFELISSYLPAAMRGPSHSLQNLVLTTTADVGTATPVGPLASCEPVFLMGMGLDFHPSMPAQPYLA